MISVKIEPYLSAWLIVTTSPLDLYQEDFWLKLKVPDVYINYKLFILTKSYVGRYFTIYMFRNIPYSLIDLPLNPRLKNKENISESAWIVLRMSTHFDSFETHLANLRDFVVVHSSFHFLPLA